MILLGREHQVSSEESPECLTRVGRFLPQHPLPVREPVPEIGEEARRIEALALLGHPAEGREFGPRLLPACLPITEGAPEGGEIAPSGNRAG